MANICDYKIVVKGRKNACYAFYGAMPAYNDKYIIKEKGTDEEYILGFGGDCKWAVDHYSKNWNGSFNIVLPDDPDEAMEEAQEKYRDICIEDRSKLFQVNVFCNSADVEDFDPAEGPNEIYVHYKNGRYIPGECPDALRIAKEYDKEPIEEVKAAFPIIIPIEMTNYEGRNERIENVKVGDPLVIKTDYYNRFYDPVAIEVFNMKNETLGYLRDGFEWESSFQIAKHIDKLEARVASVTPLSQLVKNAKCALMDVELSVKEDYEDEGYDDDEDYAEDEEASLSKEEVFKLFEHMVEFTEILDSTEEFADKLADEEYNWELYLRSDLLTFLLYINKGKKGFDDLKIETLNFVYGGEHTIEHYKELSEQITEVPDSDSVIMRGCVAYDITSCVANLMDDDDDEIMFSRVLVRLYKEMAKLFTLYDSDAKTESIIKKHTDAMEKCAENLIGNLFNTHDENDENEENDDEDYEEIKKLFEGYDEKELIDGCQIIDGALKKYTGTGKNVVIPNGVTIISDEAFSGCESLMSITIPDTVTSIGCEAFSGCKSLISIAIPDTVTSIGRKAFKDCENLTSITIPNGVTSIEWDTFDGCKSLISVIIPDSVNTIDTGAFGDCENLTSITIPNGVTSIGERAFGGCRSLTSITIPDSVTHIESYAFFRCSGLTSITIPNGVQHIGNCAFLDCENLKSITIPDSVTYIGEYAFGGTAYYEEEVIKEKTIEELRTVFPIIKAIEGTAYEGRIARIENVKVGDPLIIKADYNNPFYTPVAIEVFNMNNETLGYLEKSDIYGTAVWLPFSQIAKNIDKLEARVVSVTPLSKRRKNAKYALMDVELSVKEDTPDPVTKGTEDISTNNAKTKPVTQKKESGADKKIDDTRKTEKNAASVTTKNEPNSVEKPKPDYVIENGVFVKYTGTAKKVIIPKEIKEIADNAFADCKNLQAVELCDELVKIGKGAFKNTGLTYVDIPASVKELKDSFDDACVVAIAGEMPYYLSRTSEIEKLRTQIDAKDKLISATMNRKQTLQTALDEYDNAKPSEFSEIAQYQAEISEIEKERTDYSRKSTEKSNALNNLIAQKRAEKVKLEEERKKCFFLATSKKKELDAQIQGKQNELKMLYDEQAKLDEEFRATDNNFKEKLDKKREELDALSYMQNRWESDRNAQTNTISSVETELQGYIEEITSLKANLEKAETYERTHTEWLEKKEKALSGLNAQKYEEGEIVTFNITAEMLQSKKSETAKKASSTTNQKVRGVKIPKSDCDIEKGVFKEYYGNKKEIILPDGIREIGEYAFMNNEVITSVVVPEGVEIIQSSAFFSCSKLKNIVLPNSLHKIDDDAFYSCEHLTSVFIPEGVEIIGQNSFSMCGGLNKITLPNTLREIGKNAFYYCEKLTSIIIPEGCEIIGEDCFASCEKLKDIYVPASVRTIESGALDTFYGAVIHTPCGSVAEEFAKENGLKFDNESAPKV